MSEGKDHHRAGLGGALAVVALVLILLLLLGWRRRRAKPSPPAPEAPPLTGAGVAAADPVDGDGWDISVKPPVYQVPEVPMLPSFDVHFGDVHFPDFNEVLNVTKHVLPPWVVENVLTPLEIDLTVKPILRPFVLQAPVIEALQVAFQRMDGGDNCGCNPALKAAWRAVAAKAGLQPIPAAQLTAALDAQLTTAGTVPGDGEPA